jgi:hypothetical protein
VAEVGETMGQARRAFFAREGFAADGGYADPWADASFGPVPYAVPNPPARAAALRVHDLHHVVTGYGTSWRAESEISAWELGSGGGGRYGYAWFIALFGLFVGLLALPVATFRAFRRGRGSTNLYREPSIVPLLRRRVDDVATGLRIDADGGSWIGATVRFAAWSLLASGLGVAFVLGAPVLVLFGALRRVRCACPMRCPASA